MPFQRQRQPMPVAARRIMLGTHQGNRVFSPVEEQRKVGAERRAGYVFVVPIPDYCARMSLDSLSANVAGNSEVRSMKVADLILGQQPRQIVLAKFWLELAHRTETDVYEAGNLRFSQ